MKSITDEIRRGDTRALAKAISLVEREDSEAEKVLADLYASTGRARIIGITGSPGAGKSTLVAALAKHYRKQQKRIGIVLVETVGVGQDEVEVIRTVQTNVVILVPGMGDDIQAIKAGLMEIGDIFVVNKADRPGADRTVNDVTMMMSLAEEHGAWVPPIVKTVASRGEGVAELDSTLQKHFEFLGASGELDRRNREPVRIRIE